MVRGRVGLHGVGNLDVKEGGGTETSGFGLTPWKKRAVVRYDKVNEIIEDMGGRRKTKDDGIRVKTGDREQGIYSRLTRETEVGLGRS